MSLVNDPLLSRAQARLVAVGKLKPAEMIQEVYDAGQRHFGENYVSVGGESRVPEPATGECGVLRCHALRRSDVSLRKPVMESRAGRLPWLLACTARLAGARAGGQSACPAWRHSLAFHRPAAE